MVSANDFDVAVCDVRGVGKFPYQAILYVLRIYKIYACIFPKMANLRHHLSAVNFLWALSDSPNHRPYTYSKISLY